MLLSLARHCLRATCSMHPRLHCTPLSLSQGSRCLCHCALRDQHFPCRNGIDLLINTKVSNIAEDVLTVLDNVTGTEQDIPYGACVWATGDCSGCLRCPLSTSELLGASCDCSGCSLMPTSELLRGTR